MFGNIDTKRNSVLFHPFVSTTTTTNRTTWGSDETISKSAGDGLGSLQYDKMAASWNANMYIDPQEGIQAPRFWSLAQHAKDMLVPNVKTRLEEVAESVARLWSVSDPDLFETGFFVGPRLFVSRLRLGTLKAAKLENMSVAGYVSLASWGETCPQSATPVKCLWASDAADFGLFLVLDKNFRAPSYCELPDQSLQDMLKSLHYGDTVVAISFNGTPDRNLLEERNDQRYASLDEDDRPKIPEDIVPILHPNAKTVASGYIVGLPAKDDDSNSSNFRISSSLWAGSSGGPIFLLRGGHIQLIGMVSLYAGDREGNDAALLFDWHNSKMKVAIKRAQEQNVG
ncbi:10856_t:CDS:2 [Ambispora leptoticha]|uniref:10856_t:CDS:1 n=1 Tax=Ambispora leptoticha TaxID=144679 RepID=A0A9N8VBG9_9GLOM|nr:10856_t:CDS:2 [Ambispora leptoticha]